MDNIKSVSLLSLAGIAWLLTIALVFNLLGSTFDTRSCTTTDCMQTIYWSAFAVCVVGLIGSSLLFVQRYAQYNLRTQHHCPDNTDVNFLVMIGVGTFLY